MKKYKYNINRNDLGVYSDEHWRGYALYAVGNSLDELLEEATISEIDRDGEELATYGLALCPMDVMPAVLREIEKEIISVARKAPEGE